MTKPTKGPPRTQLTAYVRSDLKTKLAERAANEGKPEREVIEKALESHLDPPSAEEPAPKAS